MSLTKTLALTTALLLGSITIAGAFEEGKLLVWIGTNRAEDALQAVVQKFTDDLGIVHLS